MQRMSFHRLSKCSLSLLRQHFHYITRLLIKVPTEKRGKAYVFRGLLDFWNRPVQRQSRRVFGRAAGEKRQSQQNDIHYDGLLGGKKIAAEAATGREVNAFE